MFSELLELLAPEVSPGSASTFRFRVSWVGFRGWAGRI